MPRIRRVWVPGAPTHIISRFIDRRFYLASDSQRAHLLWAMGRAHERWDWKWLSYGLMSSHLHYGLIAGRWKPEHFFRSVHTSFALGFHLCTAGATLGHVFADRPAIHSLERTPQRTALLVAYQHRNPSEAGVVERPRDSRWTSHRAYLRLDPEPPFLHVEWGLHQMGFEDTEAGRCRFDEFVTEVDLRDYTPTMNRLRELDDDAEPLTTAEPVAVDWARLVAVACSVAELPQGMPVDALGHRAALARRLVSLVATRDFGQSYARVGAELGVGASCVHKLISRPLRRVDVDRLLTELRRRLAAAA
jgi:hypothetical protein